MTDNLAFLLRELHRLSDRIVEERLRQSNLTIGMWYVISVLWEEDGLSQREVSKRVGIMDPTTGAALNRMERAGMIERQSDRLDARRRLVYLTPKGRSLHSIKTEVDSQLESVAFDGLDHEQSAFLMEMLGRVQESFQNFHRNDS